MVSTVLEVESKFDARPDALAPDLTDLPGVASADARIDIELSATYFDTAELDLLRARITLRRRTGGEDAGWHLKLPWHEDRYEIREPLTGSDLVPERLRAIVLGIIRDRALIVVATVQTHRRIVRLRDAHGDVAAEFCDDLVIAQRMRSRPFVPLRWREWEFELAEPNPALAEAGARALTSAGATPALAPSKLARVLPSPAQATPPPTSFGPSATVAEVLEADLRTRVETLRRLDPLVRADLPDAVHQMRVTARRLRSVLAGYRAEFDTSVTEPLRVELGWLIERLGRARDLEVLRARVRASAGQHHPLSALMEASIVDDRATAHREAVASMASPRYFALIDALDEFCDHPAFSPRAESAAEPELVACLRAQWQRLDRAVERVEGRKGRKRALRLHEVRRRVKRLRYATEAARPVIGSRVDDLSGTLSEIQDVLGHHHDAIVAVDFVRSITDPGPEARHENRALRRRLAQQAAADDDWFHGLYRQLQDSPGVSWLR